MNLLIAGSYDEMSKLAAKRVASLIRSKPKAVLGLPTGSTPLGLYKELVAMYQDKVLSFKDITTFNLDEYEGLDCDNVNSYYRFMSDNFFNHVDINRKHTNIPMGKSEDFLKYCIEYEEKIKNSGGIDLMILGIGNNGHIGFNEPSEYFPGITHRVKLHKETIKANSRFFSCVEGVPRYAITMGIRSIMHSRSIMLLANGPGKAEAIKKAIREPITPKVPASVLQLHQDLTVIIDEEAASLLDD